MEHMTIEEPDAVKVITSDGKLDTIYTSSKEGVKASDIYKVLESKEAGEKLKEKIYNKLINFYAYISSAITTGVVGTSILNITDQKGYSAILVGTLGLTYFALKEYRAKEKYKREYEEEREKYYKGIIDNNITEEVRLRK